MVAQGESSFPAPFLTSRSWGGESQQLPEWGAATAGRLSPGFWVDFYGIFLCVYIKFLDWRLSSIVLGYVFFSSWLQCDWELNKKDTDLRVHLERERETDIFRLILGLQRSPEFTMNDADRRADSENDDRERETGYLVLFILPSTFLGNYYEWCRCGEREREKERNMGASLFTARRRFWELAMNDVLEREGEKERFLALAVVEREKELTVNNLVVSKNCSSSFSPCPANLQFMMLIFL